MAAAMIGAPAPLVTKMARSTPQQAANHASAALTNPLPTSAAADAVRALLGTGTAATQAVLHATPAANGGESPAAPGFVAGGGGGGGGGAPAAAPTPPPGYSTAADPTLDSQYLSDTGAAQLAYNQATDPLNAELASLQAADKTGQTLYQKMVANLDTQVQNTQLGDQDDLAARGITSSGETSNDITNIAAQYADQYRTANSQYGTDAADAGSRAYAIQQSLQQQQADLAMQMANAHAASLARTNATANAPIDTPENTAMGVAPVAAAPAAASAPAASDWVIPNYKGPAGFFARANSPSGFAYINAEGHIVDASAKPTGHEKTIPNPVK